MSQVLPELRYARSHEWARVEDDGTVTVGISDHAQEALGDVVFVELPDEGAELAAGDEAGTVESVKAASDIYAPVSGTVIAVNEQLEDAPETVNSRSLQRRLVLPPATARTSPRSRACSSTPTPTSSTAPRTTEAGRARARRAC
jgi:glycine cleavage system H protein